VDVASLPALPAGANTIGAVDVVSLPPVDVATLPAVTGTVTAHAGTGPWPVTDNGGSLTVDGTVAVSTLPAVSGTVTANAGTGPWPVTDNGGSLTVDGTVTLSALPALTAGSAKIGGVDLDSDATPGAAVPAVAQLVAGTDGTNARSLKTDAAGELQVDVLTLPSVTIGTLPGVAGDVAHDGVDSGNPVKQGAKAVAHGANPTAVAAADRSDLYCNRHGIPFAIGGHPNVVTLTNEYTGAQTDVALVTVSTGTKIVVVGYMVACSKANTVNVLAKLGFGTANVPASGAGVIGWHPGIDPGGGYARGNGGGILGIGADNEDLRFTCGAPTTGSVTVSVQYFTIES